MYFGCFECFGQDLAIQLQNAAINTNSGQRRWVWRPTACLVDCLIIWHCYKPVFFFVCKIVSKPSNHDKYQDDHRNMIEICMMNASSISVSNSLASPCDVEIWIFPKQKPFQIWEFARRGFSDLNHFREWVLKLFDHDNTPTRNW